jgi:methionyl-tRNA formyltransferase
MRNLSKPIIEWNRGKVLLLAKSDSWCNNAITLARMFFGESLFVFQGSENDKFPTLPQHDWYALISYRSPWVIPEECLKSSKFAINFHPGSRNYPGYNCYSFALYEKADEYGCVCHHMAKIVDTGMIIAEEKFKIHDFETIETLKFRTYIVMQSLFQKILIQLITEERLPTHDFNWSRPPFSRKDYDRLATITKEMTDEEIQLRVRSTDYSSQGARIIIGGIEFLNKISSTHPIA